MVLDCIKKCLLEKSKTYKRSFLDTISRRAYEISEGKNCHYICTRLLRSGNIKFLNKYAFRRIFGADEFFSSLFSLMNFFSVVFSYVFILRKCKANSKNYHLNVFALKMNALIWILSTAYHFHVCTITMKVDYSVASINILLNLYIFCRRLIHLHCRHKERLDKNLKKILCFFAVFHNIFILFDDSYLKIHKKISIISISSYILVLFYIVYCFKAMKHSKYLFVFVFGIFVGGLVEISDLPPYKYMIDSHAFYHFITIFLHPFYYNFIKIDIENWKKSNARKKNK